MSKFREPVIGDEHDLETYGRPTNRRREAAGVGATDTKPRAYATFDRHAARARRVDSHRPPIAGQAARADRNADGGRSQVDADGVRRVKISGQATPARRRGAERSLAMQIDRYDRRPDRAAQWALFMGVFMVVIAVVTGS